MSHRTQSTVDQMIDYKEKKEMQQDNSHRTLTSKVLTVLIRACTLAGIMPKKENQ